MSPHARARSAARSAAVLGLVVLALVLGLRRADLFGDRGMTNVVTGLVLLLAFLVALGWFVLRGPAARATRMALLGSVLLLALLASALVRLEGFSGEMIPEFAWRLAAEAVPRAPAGGLRPVDLVSTTPGDYPGFLGPGRDQTLAGPALARDWSHEPPRLLWRASAGAGWSAFALVNGWAVTMEQNAEGQHVSVRDLATGARAWSTRVDEPFFHALGGDGPRATPAVDGGRVYALSAFGRLVCLDGASGALLWEHHLSSEHGFTRADEARVVQYGRSNSPLVAGELVVLPAGGAGERQAGLVAFDKHSGERRWASPPRQVSHSSPALAHLAGVEQLLVVNEDSLSGHDPSCGRLLWEFPWPGTTSGPASVSQARAVAPDRVFVSKGYGGGAALLALAPGDGEGLAVREVWRDARRMRTKLTNVVVHQGFVYGLDDGMLECIALETGALQWKEGRYGHGQILLVGELLLLVSEEGEVLLIELRPERPNLVLGRFQGLAGKCWAHLALAGSVLALRNAEECAAWDLPLLR